MLESNLEKYLRDMSKRQIRRDREGVKFGYSNWLAQFIQLLSPNSLDIVAGRGTSKTEDILARRAIEVSAEMPGCFVAITSDTFMNAKKNVWPSIINGWNRIGWKEGIHYLVDKRPPKHFKLPYKPIFEFKNTVTTVHGTHFKTISQDRPSIGAGDSFQHVIGDEAKYLNEDKLNKLTPAVRGEYIRFGNSHLYGGRTFTTDMPNPNQGEYDWILKRADKMDVQLIKCIAQAAFVINEIKREIVNYENDGDKRNADMRRKLLKRWEDRIRPLRKRATFFYVASTFVNADVLTEDYFKTVFSNMDFSEAMVSILSMIPKLEKGLMFYPALGIEHFFNNGIDNARFESVGLLEQMELISTDLIYVDHRAPIEAGLDGGNMCSLHTGQLQGNVLRSLKDFHTLPPDFLPELAKQFCDFYKYHGYKELILYYDRALNNYKQVGDDMISKFKKAMEEFGPEWAVTMKSEHQETITQQQEYELALAMMTGTNTRLPKIQIDSINCRVTKSSMEKAQKIIRVKPNGDKSTHKDKSSERLPSHRLPMESTNMSDGYKYFICREEFLAEIRGGRSLFSGTPGAL